MIDISLYRCRIGSFSQHLKYRPIYNRTTLNIFRSGLRNNSRQLKLLLGVMFFFTLSRILAADIYVCDFAIPCEIFNTNIHSMNVKNFNCCLMTRCMVNFTLFDLYIRDNNFSARYKYGNKRNNGIKMMHWNKGNSFLENKMQDIEAIVQQHKPHLLGLSEANFFLRHNAAAVQLPEYTLHTCPTLNNPELEVSRVVVYAHNSIIVKPRVDLMSDQVSAVWLEVGLPHKRKFLVCNMYREWGYMQQQDKTSHSRAAQLARWSTIVSKWEEALLEDKEVIVMGDVNINSLKWTKDDLPPEDNINKQRSMIDLLFSKIFPLGVAQLVSVPTHQESCLDHFYSNKIEKLSEISALFNGGSDHKMISAVRYTDSLKGNVRYVRKRIFRNFDSKGFRSEVAATNMLEIYLTSDVNEAVGLLTRKLTAALDKYAPLKTIQICKHYAPWLSEETKLLMQERNRAQQAALITKDISLQREYRNLRNRVTNMMRSDKNCWEVKRLSHVECTDQYLWKNIKSTLNWNTNGPHTKLIINGLVEGSPKQLANAMNEFFVKKINTLRNKIPLPTEDPLRFLKQMMSNRTSTFRLDIAHPDEVLAILKSLKNSKATGLDTIDVATVKLLADLILPALTHIINLSLRSSTFPSEWKIAKVIPLLKKGDPLMPQNYRPVSLLPIMSKVLEKIVFKQVLNYVESNHILHPSHHGSRPHHNTCTALIEMYSSWVETVESGDITGVVMLDLSAAFDLVDPVLLIQKLELMGFQEESLLWFKSYLTGRQQCVYVDGQLSEVAQLSVGVPQGSVLGALLYILFVNELPTVGKECPGGSTCCYVDDSTYWMSDYNPEVLSNQLSQKYQLLAKYFGDNRLVINPEKTQILVLGPKRLDNIKKNVEIRTGTGVVKPQINGRLLGLTISQSMKWKDHIIGDSNSLIKALTSRIGAMKKLFLNATFKTRLLVANSCFMSILTYMIVVWGGSDSYLLKPVQVIQNKVARLVTRQCWFTPTRILLRQCNWLSVRQLIMYHTILQTWKIITNETPENIYSKFKLTHTRSRANGILAAPLFETAIGKKSFIARATTTWNTIPTDLRNTRNIITFKRKLKLWIKDNIDIH